jgi:nucleotidyltransferase/DNA polymerase involved in DNA repair
VFAEPVHDAAILAQVCTVGRSKTSVASCMFEIAWSTISTKKCRSAVHTVDKIFSNTTESAHPKETRYIKGEGVLWTVIHSSYLDPKPSSTQRCSRKTSKSVNIESRNFRRPNHLNSQVISRSQFLIAKTSPRWMKEVHRLRSAALPEWIPEIPPMWQW